MFHANSISHPPTWALLTAADGGVTKFRDLLHVPLTTLRAPPSVGTATATTVTTVLPASATGRFLHSTD